MKVYVESIFLLNYNKIKYNKKSKFGEYEKFIMNYDYSDDLLEDFQIKEKQINNDRCFVVTRERTFGYEIYVILPDYVKDDIFDGIEIIEKHFTKILDGDINKLFKIKYENYKGEYLFHQHIFNYKDKFNVEEFLKAHFKLENIEWSKYIFSFSNETNCFSAIELLCIDNFILQRHVMYEHFSREYLIRMDSDNVFYQFRSIAGNLDLLNKSRWLISNHKLVMENFKIEDILFIEQNKLFYIHRVIRKREIFEKIKEDFQEFINNSQQNLNNILMFILTVIGVVLTFMDIKK